MSLVIQGQLRDIAEQCFCFLCMRVCECGYLGSKYCSHGKRFPEIMREKGELKRLWQEYEEWKGRKRFKVVI